MRPDVHNDVHSLAKRSDCKVGLLLLQVYLALIAGVLWSYCMCTLLLLCMLLTRYLEQFSFISVLFLAELKVVISCRMVSNRNRWMVNVGD